MTRTRTWITLRSTSRRGIAMMLVLVAMVVTVVLTSAAIVSRETSPAMGQNAAALASTSWGAESAANYAVGVLAAGFDWEGAVGPDGTFMENMTVGAATVKVTLLDLEGNVPDEDDRDLIMVAVATVDGISTTVRRAISLGEPGDPMDAVDPLMGEFSLLAGEELKIDDQARVRTWILSPEASARPQFKLGTAFTKASDLGVKLLDVDLSNILNPVEMHADMRADLGFLAEMAGTPYALQWQMPLELPIYEYGVPSALRVAMVAAGDFDMEDAEVATIAPSKAYEDITIDKFAVATIDGTVPAVLRCDKLKVDDGTLRIVGDVSIWVTDDCEVKSDGAVVLADANARLRLFVGHDLKVHEDSQMGVMEADIHRTASTLTTYVDPNRVQIFDVPTSLGGNGSPQFAVENGGTLLANVHAPRADFTVKSDGTLIGRVTGLKVEIGSSGTCWYDPRLDNRIGFSNPNGPIYENDSQVNPEFEAALAEAIAGGASTVDGFMALLQVAYEDQRALALIGGLVEDTTSAVQTTVHIFTGLLGIK